MTNLRLFKGNVRAVDGKGMHVNGPVEVYLRSDVDAEIGRLWTALKRIEDTWPEGLEDTEQDMREIARQALSGAHEPSGQAYFETHEPPHCPTCDCPPERRICISPGCRNTAAGDDLDCEAHREIRLRQSGQKSSEQECRRAGLSETAAGTGLGNTQAEARSSRREVTAQPPVGKPCDRCGGTMPWCSTCLTWTRSCCVPYGTCHCS